MTAERSTDAPARVGAAPQGSLSGKNWGERTFYGLVCLALTVGLAGRLLTGWGAPLWLDEAFTGAIVIRPSFEDMIQDCLKELGGPAYYMLMWGWVKIFGAGDIALRLPSFIFAIATPLVILWKGHPDRRVRATWAAISATWLPAFYYATEARSYSLLFLLGSIQVIFFVRLLKAGDIGRACAWSAVSSLIILTHTHGAIITAFQGLLLLAIHRRALFRLWPAALLLLPAVIWFLMRLPFLMGITNAGTTWLRLLKPHHLATLPDLLFGHSPIALPIALFVLGTSILLAVQARKGSLPHSFDRKDWLPAVASILAIAGVIGLGFLKPSFTFRYLIPFVPGFLLGISLLTLLWSRWIIASLLIASFSVMAAIMTLVVLNDHKLDFRYGYSWEGTSGFLRQAQIRRLVFVWDNPTATGADRDLLGRVGAFFLHREGLPVTTDAVTIGSGSDEDFRRAIFTATSQPQTAREAVGVITLGRYLPLQQPGARWQCRRYGGPKEAYDAPFYITACVRPPL